MNGCITVVNEMDFPLSAHFMYLNIVLGYCIAETCRRVVNLINFVIFIIDVVFIDGTIYHYFHITQRDGSY